MSHLPPPSKKRIEQKRKEAKRPLPLLLLSFFRFFSWGFLGFKRGRERKLEEFYGTLRYFFPLTALCGHMEAWGRTWRIPDDDLGPQIHAAGVFSATAKDLSAIQNSKLPSSIFKKTRKKSNQSKFFFFHKKNMALKSMQPLISACWIESGMVESQKNVGTAKTARRFGW